MIRYVSIKDNVSRDYEYDKWVLIYNGLDLKYVSQRESLKRLAKVHKWVWMCSAHHHHHTQCIPLIENYGQGLGREERR